MLHSQELIENPSTVRQKEEGDILGPRGDLEGKSCLAASSLVLWPCHGLGTSRWRTALQVPLSTRDLVTQRLPAHNYWKNHSFDYTDLRWQSGLCFLLSKFVIAFLPRIKHLLILQLQIIVCSNFGGQEKSVTASTFSTSICHEVMGLGAMTLVFWMLSFKPAFSLSSFTFIKRLFSSPLLSAIRVVSSAYLRLLIFLP